MTARASSVYYSKIRIFERGGPQRYIRNRSGGFTYYSVKIAEGAARRWKLTVPLLVVIFGWMNAGTAGFLVVGALLVVWIAVGVGLRRRAGGAAGRAVPTPEEIRQRRTVRRQWELACNRAKLLGEVTREPLPIRSMTGNGHGTIFVEVPSAKYGVPVDDVAAAAKTLAGVVGCQEVVVTEPRIGVARLEFHFRDALNRLVTLADIPPAPPGQVAYGIRADGSAASFNYAQSLLIGGLTRHGKSNFVWDALGGLEAMGMFIDAYVSDPKGGIELDELEKRVPLDADGKPIPMKFRKGPRKLLEVRAYASTPDETIEMVKAAEAAMKVRQRELKAAGTRAVLPGTSKMPLVIIILDETLPLTELLRKGVDSPLGRIAYTGGALGYVVWFNSQVGQKESLGPVRDLIPQRICFATPNPQTTDAVFGDSAEAAGARCSALKGKPGRGYSWNDTGSGYRSFKAALVTDSEVRQIAAGEVPRPVVNARREASLRAAEEAMASKPRKERQTSLYRIFAGKGHEGIEPGTIAYIGISYQAIDRFMQHDAGFREFMQGDYEIRVQQLPNRSAALAAEKDAILNEKPLFNKEHNRNNPRRRIDWRGRAAA